MMTSDWFHSRAERGPEFPCLFGYRVRVLSGFAFDVVSHQGHPPLRRRHIPDIVASAMLPKVLDCADTILRVHPIL